MVILYNTYLKSATLYKTRHYNEWTWCIEEQLQTLTNIYRTSNL